MAQTLERESIQQAMYLCHFLTHLPRKELYARYDEEADVLYLQFQQPANIHTSEIQDDGIIIEYDNADNIVGLTILEASKPDEARRLLKFSSQFRFSDENKSACGVQIA